ncbi:MAG: metallophosphoesterase [Sulfurimonas sp.]|uniref:metallophosphoesterase n=1 Tax=Sulfurimonas sp. TaxID=2022749 RepID=UPI00260A14AA|nr:metallophosphoesterase [Sulfurimonas sp.]MDD5401148.1 metallophosphoesterase [Sulfurimonas sp.]
MSLQVGWNYFPFREINIKSHDFCTAFCGLRIIQLSDLHLTKKVDIVYLKTLVRKINEQKPDLVVFTGDIIQTKALRVKEQIEVFKGLEAKAYFVTGNHDIVYGVKELQAVMNESNIICLDNEIVKVQIKDFELQLVGLSDRYSFFRGIKRPIKELFSKLDPNLPTILLAHQPKDIEHIGSHRIDVQLSGHTHGGQIYPISLLVKLFQPYFSGLYMYKKTVLYVSNGVGYWGLNIRYKAGSEIAVLTIN